MSILDVTGVSKSFGGVKANVDISMSVEQGSIVGLIGPNGSGKTTLFNSIVGTYPIDKGSIKFDGKEVSEVVPALGYILGDEGSGSYFGKKLLAAYLYHQLPAHLTADFEATYGLDKDAIVDKVYREPNANVFIASFMPFIAKHSDEPYFQAMIEAGFKHFMEVHVCCYPNYKEADIHFVGSLAGIFRSALDRAAASLGISVTSVIRKPVEGLVNYHLKYILNDKITQA